MAIDALFETVSLSVMTVVFLPLELVGWILTRMNPRSSTGVPDAGERDAGERFSRRIIESDAVMFIASAVTFLAICYLTAMLLIWFPLEFTVVSVFLALVGLAYCDEPWWKSPLGG